MSILLNADVGEGLASDVQLYPFLDQASIACGGHCGDAKTMQQAVLACKKHDVRIGAHPSYPDKKNFGRASMQMESSQLIESIRQQVNSLDELCQAHAVTPSFVKPHGALYSDMMCSSEVFELIVMEVARYPLDLALMIGALPARTTYQFIANEFGVPLLREAFADRLYLDNGQLSPRSEPEAVFSDPKKIITQASSIKINKAIFTATNQMLTIEADSLCLHGDNPASVAAIHKISRE